jgi:membrane-bound lytic murein transglycosylase D
LVDPKHAYLPHESRNYIRTVVALAFLGSEDPYLSQYTLPQEAVENPIATIYLPKGEKIDRIAAVLEMPKTKLVSLNTHLKKGVTPPNEQSYPIYIPKDKLEAFQEKFRPKDIKGYFIMHNVKSGETLDQLSKRYHVPKNSIMMENMIGENEDHNLDRRVKIPITKPFIKNPRLYTAKSGETLASVAALYNTTIEQLKIKNPFASNVLKEGEEIKVAD